MKTGWYCGLKGLAGFKSLQVCLPEERGGEKGGGGGV